MLSESAVGLSAIQIFERNTTRNPGNTALIFDQGTLTYSDLNASANELARHLLEQGIVPGSRVCVLFDPCPSIIITLLALLKLGATYVPLDVEYPINRLKLIVDDVDPHAIITRTQFLSLLDSQRQLVNLDEYPLLKHDPLSESNLDLSIEEALPAYIFFTSGTTGAPKGVIATRANLSHYTRSAIVSFGMDCTTIMPTIARLTFSISLFELLCPLLAGGTVKILPRATVIDIPLMVSLFPEFTMLHMGPSLLAILLRYIDENSISPEKFKNIAHISSGGDIVKPELLAKLLRVFTSAEVFVVYGCTEVACMGCFLPVTSQTLPSRTTIGQPFSGVSVLLLDGSLATVNYPDWGEIYIAGGGVTKEYLNRPNITVSRYFELDGLRYYRTGDLGRRRPDGNIEFLGREDHQIQIHGVRIELGEVEANLIRIPGIKEAIATGRPDNKGELVLVAYLVLEKESPADFNSIKTFLSEQLPKYLIPSIFVSLESLPLNHNLKLDRSALPPPDVTNTINRATEFVPAENATEEKLLAIWSRLFQRDDVGVHHDFFDLHGDSLLAIELMIAVEKEFLVQLPLSTLLTHPTVKSLAPVLAEPGATNIPQNDLFVMQQGTGGSAVFLIHGALVYKELCDHISQSQTVCVLYQNNEAESIGRDDLSGLMATYGSIKEIADHYLRSIKAYQPHGPYNFVGFSIGGLIAMEMSHALLEEGEAVGDIILVDAHVPQFARQALLRKVIYHVKKLLTRGVPHLKYLSWKVLMQFHGKRNSTTTIHRDRATKEELRRQARNNASSFYLPKIFPQKATLFKASVRPEYELEDEYLGWRNYLPNLEIVNLIGDHEDLLAGENAVKIALTIAKWQ